MYRCTLWRMNITIDTSVILSVCTNEPTKQQLIAQTTGARLIAPASIHWEVGNALSAMIKRGRITKEQAQLCLRAYKQIPVRFVDIDIEDALFIAARFKIYAYDAYLMACASQYSTPLLTLDGALKVHAAELGLEVLGE
jgi:predicted nucleic acid-binding protein